MFASKESLIQYITQAFRPVQISAPIKQWKALKSYKTPIFSAHFTFPYPLNYYSNLETYPHVSFSFASPGTGSKQDHLFSADSNILSTLGVPHENPDRYENRPSFSLPIYAKGDDSTGADGKGVRELPEETIVTLDSQGKIPERWMKMLADFSSLQEFKIQCSDTNPWEQLWTNKIQALPPVVFDGLVLNCLNAMSDSSLSLKVFKAPLYTKADWEKYFDRKFDEKELQYQTWCTDDHNDLSPATRIFFERCRRFHSFYPSGYLNEGDEKERMLSCLFKCGGGISLDYYSDQPWWKFASRANWRSCYSEINGTYHYSPYKGVSFEELVLLSEALRAEGESKGAEGGSEARFELTTC